MNAPICSYQELGERVAEAMDRQPVEQPEAAQLGWAVEVLTSLSVTVPSHNGLEEFLLGLGSVPLPSPDSKKIYSPEIEEALAAFAHAKLKEGEAVSKAKWKLDSFSDDAQKRRYQHVPLARYASPLLEDIFGKGRNPGDVVEEAIDVRFRDDLNLISCKRFASICENLARRLKFHEVFSIFNLVRLICWSTKAGNPEARFDGQLMLALLKGFNDDPLPREELTQLALSLGGLLGGTLLELAWGGMEESADEINSVTADAAIQTVEWILFPELMKPWVPASISTEDRDAFLSYLSAIRFTPDYGCFHHALLCIDVLLKQPWWFETNSFQFDSLPWLKLLNERLRTGSAYLIWKDGGIVPSSPDDLSWLMSQRLGYNLWEGGSPWDVSISLAYLTQQGFDSQDFFHETEIVPHPGKIWIAFRDAIHSQHFELAEALMCLSLVADVIWPLEGKNPGLWFDAEDFISWRESMPRDFALLAPLAHCLSASKLVRTQADKDMLRKVAVAFGLKDNSTAKPNKTFDMALIRSELTINVMGESFFALPSHVKSGLVDAHYAWRVHESNATEDLTDLGTFVVGYVKPFESLLIEKLEALDPLTKERLQENFKVDQISFGTAINIICKFQRLSPEIQLGLQAVIPALPLDRLMCDQLFFLNRKRNEGAHGQNASSERKAPRANIETLNEVKKALFGVRVGGVIHQDIPGLLELFSEYRRADSPYELTLVARRQRLGK